VFLTKEVWGAGGCTQNPCRAYTGNEQRQKNKNAFLPARWGKEKTQITSAPSQQNIGAAPAFIPQPRKNIDALRPEPKGREPFF
jgi:hypothetical protein